MAVKLKKDDNQIFYPLEIIPIESVSLEEIIQKLTLLIMDDIAYQFSYQIQKFFEDQLLI